MSKPAAKMLDMAGHGGMIMMGEFTVLINGMPAARVGDPLMCPGFNGPIPHIMGNIVMGSTTVQIGGGFAARMGDQTGCGIAGMIAKGMPAIFGPAIFTMAAAPAIKGAYKTEQEGIERGDNVTLLANSSSGYNNASGSQDSIQGSLTDVHGKADVLGRNWESHYRLGAVSAETHSSSGTSIASTGYTSEASAGHIQVQSTPDQRETDTLTVKAFTANAGYDFLAGNDGRRTGLAMGISAEAAVLDVQYDDEEEYEIPFTGFSVKLRATGGLSGGSVGVQAGAGAYHDAQDNRVHVNAVGGLELEVGAKLGLDISVGLAAPAPTVSILGIGIPLTPGTILKGSHNVMIGG